MSKKEIGYTVTGIVPLEDFSIETEAATRYKKNDDGSFVKLRMAADGKSVKSSQSTYSKPIDMGNVIVYPGIDQYKMKEREDDDDE